MSNGNKHYAKRLTAYEIANRIYDLIPSREDDNPISIPLLSEKAGVTYSQVPRGIAYLRDSFPENSLVSSSRGIQWTMDDEKVKKYWNSRVRTALTQFRRTWRGSLKPWLEGTHRAEVKAWNKTVDRLLEDITDALQQA